MSMIYHPGTNLNVGDPERLPVDPASLPSPEALRAEAENLILSASGWRKVFADLKPPYAPWASSPSPDDSLSETVSAPRLLLAALMAESFGRFLLAQPRAEVLPAVLLGIDSRPTGPALADVFARVLLGLGIEVRHCFIVAAPEIMAYAGKASAFPPGHPERVMGFAYISASHNPPGHNGVKFGLGSGGVLSAREINPLIAELKAAIASEESVSHALALMQAADTEALAQCYERCGEWKRRSRSAYTLFSHEVISGKKELEKQALLLDELSEACRQRPLGIVAELNGSARSLSIDRDFFNGITVRSEFFNDTPRQFTHRIVPEGISLEACMELLQKARERDSSFQLGYVPDCDGDRGNLVFYDKSLGKARILEAQDVFSLSCLAVLAGLGVSALLAPVAVVVNDATSGRIERIAGFFGVKVFRAETGEANVVNCAEKLRSEGWIVRILGEGSNGGTITHPSKVRDPLSTLGAMIRLLRTKDKAGSPGLFRRWLEVSGQDSAYKADFDLADVIATLPAWISTSVFESRAALTIQRSDKAALKARYARIFKAEWESRKKELNERYGIAAWKALASAGSREFEVGEDFAASGSGGLRIVLLDASAALKGFLWMRGSGTEPVFRIMADLEGGKPKDEEYLLSWHSGMVRKADTSI
ncbi:MAG: phosphatidylglycerol lysyltransferase [Spirochaetia bacterium]|nr:phosphatidylglycerol lysyltransferase [Spirochaetia bacterium]